MSKKDPRIDAYIAKAQPFARPILTHLRALVHKAVPDVEETMKWSAPAFDYKGPFCSFAAFKQHAVFGFWKAALLQEQLPGSGATINPGNQFGKLASIDDLPADREVVRLIKLAARLNDEGIKAPPMRKGPRPELKAPADLLAALSKSKKAKATYDAFPPGQRREYIAWVTEAKQAKTREQRIKTAVEWMGEGKPRNWKYMK